MAKLILNGTLEISVNNFYEANNVFTASGSGTIPESIGTLVTTGLDLTSYEAEYTSGKEFPIFGTYDHATATTNGSQGDGEYEGYTITLGVKITA